MAQSLPVAVLLGIYLGLVAGVVPALITGVIGFAFKYVTGVTAPGFGVVVLAVAVAGANGGFMALQESTIRSSPTLVTALIVVMMLALYAHNEGDKLGASMPRRLPWRDLRERTLSTDVIELVGRSGQVRVSVAGDVADIEGYPPLSPELRGSIAGRELTFPADLGLAELGDRVADRLRTEYDLAEVAVSVDERGRARVAAAPPSSGLSKRVPAGDRAVTLRTLVPTGLARGDVVRVTVAQAEADSDAVGTGQSVEGTVVSAASDPAGTAASAPASVASTAAPADAAADAADPNEEPTPVPTPRAPTTIGGDGRLTLAVDRDVAEGLLDVSLSNVVVQSRGIRREFELLSLLRRAGKRFRRVTLRDSGELAGRTLGAVDFRDAHDVAVLAVRRTVSGTGDREWDLAPDGTTPLSAGDDLFVVGSRDALDRFGTEVA
jgi:hypothetical protein